MYCRAGELTYPAIVEAIRRGRTFATNGGPLFPFVTIDGKGPGETIEPGGDRPHALRAEVRCLYPLEVGPALPAGRARPSRSTVAGKRGEVALEATLRETPGERAWYVLRVEDERGHWAITSPIYVEPARAGGPPVRLVPDPGDQQRDPLRRAAPRLLRPPDRHRLAGGSPGVGRAAEGRPGRASLRAGDGGEPDGREGAGDRAWPATTGRAGPGPSGSSHFQADWPVEETGWYGLRAATAGGRTLASDEVFFDASHGASRALSVAHLDGPGTRWAHRGYGEEMPLAEIRTPFEGDHWWYPSRSYWRVLAQFGRERRELVGGEKQGSEGLFRTPSR